MGIIGHISPEIVLGLLLGEDPTKERKRTVARILAEKVDRQYPFSIGYLENIVTGRQECSPHGDMYQALMLIMEEVAVALIERVDGRRGSDA